MNETVLSQFCAGLQWKITDTDSSHVLFIRFNIFFRYLDRLLTYLLRQKAYKHLRKTLLHCLQQ